MALLGVTVLLGGCSAFDSFRGGGGDAPQASDIPTALVVDGSGSMNTDDAPGPRIDAARTAAHAFIDALPDGTEFGLWTYGLNTSDSEEDHDAGCRDTTNLIPSGDVDRDAAKAAVDGITPRGWSPIASTMRQAGESLPTDREASLVVVTDGEDHCGQPTICEVAKELHRTHPLLRIDAVGFLIDDPELGCAARETGGLYVTADNTDQLTARLAASRDAELSKRTLSGRSLQGIEVGAAHSAIAEAYGDFPSLSDGRKVQCTTGDCGAEELTVIRWRDCDWYFTPDGILDLVDPGEGARTIDGIGVGDDAAELARYYGEPVQERSGDLDGDPVSIRWYTADTDLGLAWRVVVDEADKIRAIVLCRCLPGTGGGDSDGSGAAAAGNTGGGGGGDRTEVLVFDVFEDDGTVREPFQSIIVDGTRPSSLACNREPEPGTSLHSCGQYATDWTVGHCSIADDTVYCPSVSEGGEVSIVKYPFDQYLDGSNPPAGNVWPTAAVDSDGTVYVRYVIPGTEYSYMNVSKVLGNGGSTTGLLSGYNVYPFDNSSPMWTATFGQGDMGRSGGTIDIVRVYFFE